MGALCSSPQPSGEPASPTSAPAPAPAATAVQVQPASATVSDEGANANTTTTSSSSSSTATATTASAPASSATAPSSSSSSSSSHPHKHTPTIYIIYYSMYGHIAQLAEEVAKGVAEAGAQVKIFRFAETLSQDVLDKMHAPPKNEAHPVITPDELKVADGIIFGIPTRFGQGAAQTKAFWDSTGQLWQAGALAGKTAGVFVSTATQGGGQETTAFTQLTHFVHHAMIYVPIGYTSPLLFNMDEVHGGSPYGAGTLAGPTGARQPTKLEKDVAHHQGKHFATVTAALSAGRQMQLAAAQ